jgi:Txe/YoeB family toxin of Txe-Axe toxin-antitoxin module
MNETYSDQFVKSLKKFSSIKKKTVKKIDTIIRNPLMGEPLKYDLRGLYSTPVSKNFLIIYSYCGICRKKGDHKILLCHDCADMSAETVRFFDLGPHDKVYEV